MWVSSRTGQPASFPPQPDSKKGERTGDVRRGSSQSVRAEQGSLVGLSEAAEPVSVGLGGGAD